MTKTWCFNFGQTFSPSLARASELPGVFIQMQIPGSHARASESEFLEVDPGMYKFNKLIRISV